MKALLYISLFVASTGAAMFFWHVVSEWKRKRLLEALQDIPVHPIEFYGEPEVRVKLILFGEEMIAYRQKAKVRMSSGKICVMDYQWVEPEDPDQKHLKIPV